VLSYYAILSQGGFDRNFPNAKVAGWVKTLLYININPAMNKNHQPAVPKVRVVHVTFQNV
jgi:hypothetical protein